MTTYYVNFLNGMKQPPGGIILLAFAMEIIQVRRMEHTLMFSPRTSNSFSILSFAFCPLALNHH